MPISINEEDTESNSKELYESVIVVTLTLEEQDEFINESYVGQLQNPSAEVNEDVESVEDPEVYEFVPIAIVTDTPSAVTSGAKNLAKGLVVDSLTVPVIQSDATLSLGAKVANAAIKDYNDKVRENPIKAGKKFSMTGPRVDAYLKVIHCDPGKPWALAAVAAWFKESGAEIPTGKGQAEDAVSAAKGWVAWAKKTQRFSTTPTIGAAIVYGVKTVNIETPTHLGCVVQVIDGGRVLSIEAKTVTTTDGTTTIELQQVEVNNTATMGFIFASEPEKKSEPAKKSDPEKKSDQGKSKSTSVKKPGQKITAEQAVKNYANVIRSGTGWDPNKKGLHVTAEGLIVFQQSSAKQSGNDQKPPWLHTPYGAPWVTENPGKDNGVGKRAGGVAVASDIQEGGCGLCALGAVMRNLTGNENIDPGALALKYGHFHAPAGTIPSAMTKIPPDYGCVGTTIDIKIPKKGGQTSAQLKAKFDAVLATGGQIVICGGRNVGPFWSGGHYVYIGKHNTQLDHYHIGNSFLLTGGLKDFVTPYKWDNLIKGMTSATAIKKK